MEGEPVIATKLKAIVHNNGLIYWSPSLSLKSACIIDTTFYPFDVQECTIRMEPWTSPVKEVNLIMNEWSG